MEHSVFLLYNERIYNLQTKRQSSNETKRVNQIGSDWYLIVILVAYNYKQNTIGAAVIRFTSLFKIFFPHASIILLHNLFVMALTCPKGATGILTITLEAILSAVRAKYYTLFANVILQ